MLEEKSSYEAAPVTQGGIGYRRVSNVYGSEARLFVMDIPLLDDADDVGRALTGFYWGAGAYGAPWPACTLFQSEDGTIYAAADTALAAVTWGAVVNVLGPTDTPFQTDLVNTLEIALVGGEPPESVTTEEMLAGANRAAVIRADGTAEIIHFQDVTATAAGTYVLSTLLRGRRGTEVFVPGHQPGEMFVLLDDSAAINRRLVPLDRVGNTLHLAAVARGGDAGNSTPQVIEFAGNDLKPYAPVHFAASGSFGSDITLTWVRRTRVGGDLEDGFGTVLLAEDAEEYELEILGPDDEVRRTVTDLTSLSFTYTTAMQAVDFPEGYPASAFVVYQLSAQVGRGFAARLDFPDAPQFATLGEDIAEGQAGSGTSNFPANTVMAQRYERHLRPGALGVRLPRQPGQRQHADRPVRRQCGRARRSDRDHRGERLHRHQRRALGGAHVQLAAHDGRGRQVLARLPHRRERQQPGLRRQQPERRPPHDRSVLRERSA